jgi:hypothetical protein
MLMARSNWDVEWETVLEHVSVKWNQRGRTQPALFPFAGERDGTEIVALLLA